MTSFACRAILALAFGLVLVSEPLGAQAVEASRPAICWRSVSSEVLGSRPGIVSPAQGSEGFFGWLKVSVGVGQTGLLPWGDSAGVGGDGAYGQFEVRGDEPHVFVEGDTEGRVVWINATARGHGIDRLTIGTRRAGTGSCRSGEVGTGDFLEVEAVAVGGATSCMRWPLPAPGETGSVSLAEIFGDRPGSLCFPTAVPDVVGRPLSEAKRLISEAGLQLGRAEARPSRGQADVVLEQHPPATSGAILAPQSAVDLVIAGQRFVDIPSLTGKTVAQAERIIEPFELLLEARSGGRGVEVEDLAGYRVASQKPESGESVPVGSVVEVEALVEVPSLVGLSLDEVVRASADLGLTVSWDRRGGTLPVAPSDAFAVDVQIPLAGQSLSYGGAIEVDLSAVVPELRELPVVEASNRARERGLRPDPSFEREIRRARSGFASVVVSQNPPPGSRVSPGDAIGVGTEVPVPDLRGKSVAGAIEQLEAAGLTYDPAAAEPERWTSAKIDHRIEDQRPAPGTPAASGALVEMDVSVLVPALAEKTRGGAEASLDGVRLRLGEVRSWPATSRLGTVVTQRPAANTWVLVGKAIDVALAEDLLPVDPWRVPWFWLLALLALLGGWSLVRAQEGKLPKGVEVKGVLDRGAQSFERNPDEPADLEVGISFRIHSDVGRQSLVESETKSS